MIYFIFSSDSFGSGVETVSSLMSLSSRRAFRFLKGLKFPKALEVFTASPLILSSANGLKNLVDFYKIAISPSMVNRNPKPVKVGFFRLYFLSDSNEGIDFSLNI